MENKFSEANKFSKVSPIARMPIGAATNMERAMNFVTVFIQVIGITILIGIAVSFALCLICFIGVALLCAFGGNTC